MSNFLALVSGFVLGWGLCLAFCIYKYIEMQHYYEERREAKDE